LSERYGVDAASFEQILGDASIAAIAQHADLARAALDAGKQVFVEKPLALTVREAEMLCELARERDRRSRSSRAFRSTNPPLSTSPARLVPGPGFGISRISWRGLGSGAIARSVRT
jgi:hypothetical protein